MKTKKKKRVLLRLIVLILALVLLTSSSGLSFLLSDEMAHIYGAFIGNKSEYNGVIEVWNIDSFEGGTKPKVSYLEYQASRFQKENKGTYLVIRNLTEGECVNLINGGVVPDLISCSYGVSEKIKDYASAYSANDLAVNENFLKAGRNKEGELIGLAWCVGCYFLISTKSKLEKVKVIEGKTNLNEIAFDCEYEFKIGKKTKTSLSLCYGTSDYLMPKEALFAYNKARSIQVENSSQSELVFKSQYSAYSSFLASGATILLGTQRDVWRMQTREESGKAADVVYLPLDSWTDLVQYIFILKNSNGKRKEYAEKFACSLVSDDNQKMIESIGMFPVNLKSEVIYDGVMCDITLENIGNLEPKMLFE